MRMTERRFSGVLIFCLVLSTLLLAQLLPGARAGGGRREEAEKLIRELKEAPRSRRPLLVEKLIALGPEALETVRAARDAAEDPGVRKHLGKAAIWQLATAITPVLEAGLETQLTFDGQYSDLEKHGKEGVRTLLAIVDGSTEPLPLRLAACRALADVGDASILTKLRSLYGDILLYDVGHPNAPELLRDQIGILLAIFGDTHGIEGELKKHQRFVRHERWNIRLSANLQLSNLYYRIRNYKRAVEHYEEILQIYATRIDEDTIEIESLHREIDRLAGADSRKRQLERARHQRRREGLQAELKALRTRRVLHYYNAACSNSLHGKIERARTYLKKAVQGDPTHMDNMEKDGDLAKLRAHPSYQSFRKNLGKLFEGRDL